ncbi:hypothetical protein QBC34DRAFT_197638 [Podospora aff. communis PSN243]|uniref:Uncharacterized protein n=1 Tax=Podospora aff. communis PSN243 TaxID=3040156 RepID=A0AAV9G5Y5_9PEZI|nr:hypothetical protein QBC34DRAFT_197638 [Podospora aff. communis PSN243]
MLGVLINRRFGLSLIHLGAIDANRNFVDFVLIFVLDCKSGDVEQSSQFPGYALCNKRTDIQSQLAAASIGFQELGSVSRRGGKPRTALSSSRCGSYSSGTMWTVRRIGSAAEGAESFPHVPPQKNNAVAHTAHSTSTRCWKDSPDVFETVIPPLRASVSTPPAHGPFRHRIGTPIDSLLRLAVLVRKGPHRATSRCEGGGGLAVRRFC